MANEANLFCVVGQDIFLSALLDGPMMVPSGAHSPVVVLDHDSLESIGGPLIIETFFPARSFRRDSRSNPPKLIVRLGLTRSTLSRSDLVRWHFSDMDIVRLGDAIGGIAELVRARGISRK